MQPNLMNWILLCRRQVLAVSSVINGACVIYTKQKIFCVMCRFKEERLCICVTFRADVGIVGPLPKIYPILHKKRYVEQWGDNSGCRDMLPVSTFKKDMCNTLYSNRDIRFSATYLQLKGPLYTRGPLNRFSVTYLFVRYFQFYAAVSGTAFAGFVGGYRAGSTISDEGHIFSGYTVVDQLFSYRLGAAFGQVHVIVRVA